MTFPEQNITLTTKEGRNANRNENGSENGRENGRNGGSSKGEILKWVETYYEHGLTPLPLKPKSKEPAISWGDWKNRRPSQDEVEMVFLDAMKRYGDDVNIGLLCGREHNLVVLDIDDPEKFEIARQSIGLEIPTTPLVKTRRGYHIYFRFSEGCNVRVYRRLDDWGAELRGNGGYVVAPPSVVEGSPYEFAQQGEKVYSVWEVKMVDIPKELVEAFVPLPQQNTPFVSTVSFLDELDALRQGEETLPDELREEAGELKRKKVLGEVAVEMLAKALCLNWQEGVRHDLSLSLAGWFAKEGVAYESVVEVLKKVAKEAGDTELRDRLRAVKDTYEKAAKEVDVVGWSKLRDILGEETAKMLAAVLGAAVVTYSTPEACETQSKPSQSPSTPKITLVSWAKAMEMRNVRREWLIDGFVKEGDLGVLMGRPKTGKSILLANIAKSLVEGTPFLGKTTRKSIVIYLDLERPTETDYRFERMGIKTSELLFTFPSPVGADCLDALEEAIQSLQSLRAQYSDQPNQQIPEQIPVVVLVDTIHDFLRPELRRRRASINDYDHIADILQKLRDFCQRTNTTFIFTHHQRKGLGEEPSEMDLLGSTAVAGKLDFIVSLSPDKTDAGVTHFTIEGNALLKQHLCYTVGEDGREFVATKVDTPSRTKEEKARKAIARYLHNYGATKRKDLVEYLVDLGLCESEETAKKLFKRAVDDSPYFVTAERGVYELTDKGREWVEGWVQERLPISPTTGEMGDVGDGDEGGVGSKSGRQSVKTDIPSAGQEGDERDKGTSYIYNVPNVPNDVSNRKTKKGQKGQRGHVPYVPNVPNVPNDVPIAEQKRDKRDIPYIGCPFVPNVPNVPNVPDVPFASGQHGQAAVPSQDFGSPEGDEPTLPSERKESEPTPPAQPNRPTEFYSSCPICDKKVRGIIRGKGSDRGEGVGTMECDVEYDVEFYCDDCDWFWWKSSPDFLGQGLLSETGLKSNLQVSDLQVSPPVPTPVPTSPTPPTPPTPLTTPTTPKNPSGVSDGLEGSSEVSSQVTVACATCGRQFTISDLGEREKGRLSATCPFCLVTELKLVI